MTYNQRPQYYDYYQPSACMPPNMPLPCPPPPGPGIRPGSPWDFAIAEHNAEKSAHPHILSLIKGLASGSGSYLCVDSLAQRDLIDPERRSIGLLAYVLETDAVYQLISGIENTDWQETNINAQKYIKLGRYNPPANPENGTIYVDLKTNSLMIFIDSWIKIPSQKDIDQAIIDHNTDISAHAEKFAEVENAWFSI